MRSFRQQDLEDYSRIRAARPGDRLPAAYAGLDEEELLQDALWKGITKGPLEYASDEHSVLDEVEWHLEDLRAYIRTKYPRASEEGHLRDLLAKPPQIPRTVIENYLLNDAMKMEKLENIYVQHESVVTQTLGMRGRRKTITTWDFVERVKERTGKGVYSTAEEDRIPPWANPIIRIEDAPPGAIIVEDELAAEKAARNFASGDQKLQPAFLATLRQREQHYFGIVQNTAASDVAVPLFADVILIKPVSLMQIAYERKPLKKLLETWDELMPKEDWQTLALSSYLHPVHIERPIPTWWEPDFSKSYAAIPTLHGAVQRAAQLRAGRLYWSSIATRMASRGWPRGAEWWESVVIRSNGGVDPNSDNARRKKKKAEAAPAAAAPQDKGVT